MSEPASLIDTVRSVRAAYPAPTRGDLGAMLNEIAWIHRADGWGLSRKTAGNHTIQPRTGERIAVDILQHEPTNTLWDCFVDAGGATTPGWHRAESHGDLSRIWLPPVEPIGQHTPPPDAGDTATQIAALRAALVAVAARAESVETRAAQAEAHAAEARERMTSLEELIGHLRVKGAATVSAGGVTLDLPVTDRRSDSR